MRVNDTARAAAALNFIEAGVSRTEWVRILTAAKAAGLDFETVDKWSSSAPNYKSTKDVQSVWRGLKADGGITAGTLFHMALQAGWRDDGKASPPQWNTSKPTPEHEQPKKPAHAPQDVWGRCIPADTDHAYIQRKGGLPDELRVYPKDGERLTIAGRSMNGYLVIPCRSLDGDIQSLQFIPPQQGQKLNLPGCTMAGGFHVVGDLKPDGLAYVCEGISAAWAAWKATGHAALVAFGWGNVSKIAVALTERYPALSLVLLPDAGKESSAQEIAASLLHCGWVELPKGWANNSDVGDFAARHGTDELESLLADGVKHPAPAEGENTKRANPANLRFCDARDGTATTRPLSELGNAQRLQDNHGDKLRYIPESKSWIVWSEGSWVISTDGGLVRNMATSLPEQIYLEGADNLAEAEYFAKWARNSQRQQTINAAVGLLSDMPDIRVPAAKIDADPWLVGLDEGRQVLDLKTGTARPAQPADLITKALGVSTLGEPDKAVRWRDFLEQVFLGDRELIDWLQRWSGYLLTGSTREQLLLFGYGHGANGKSVFAEVLRHLMGDYAAPIQSETLTETKRTAGGASPDLAALVGTRMAMATETEDGCALAESLVKSLTAGDALSVRPLYGTPFTFLPAFKLLMLGNHKPVIRGTDLGIWRRIRLVPFTRTFAPEERDSELTTKLKAEAPHILAWMLQGCMTWQRQGLADVPATITSQTEQYRSDMDTLGQWLGECCITGPATEAPSKDLYASYQAWATDNGLRPCSNQAFGRRLTERGFGERKGTAGMRYRTGLDLATSTFNNGYADN